MQASFSISSCISYVTSVFIISKVPWWTWLQATKFKDSKASLSVGSPVPQGSWADGTWCTLDRLCLNLSPHVIVFLCLRVYVCILTHVVQVCICLWTPRGQRISQHSDLSISTLLLWVRVSHWTLPARPKHPLPLLYTALGLHANMWPHLAFYMGAEL